jgi:NAD(P)-dependent dehydrogenase (short-subunit alcohol dehydrogenase family)
MSARSPTKASAAIAKIKEAHPNADIHALILDHMQLSTVVEAAKGFMSKETKLHGLILNAGIMATPYEITEDGFESQMQVNYLAHWLFTYHLLPILLSTARAEGPGSVRVACVSSEGHARPFGVTKILYNKDEIAKFGDFGRYGVSKLANVLEAKSLNDAYGPQSESAKDGKGEIWCASLHPGFIDTQLNEGNRDRSSWYLAWLHPVLRLFGAMRPWEEGCVSSVFVAASPQFTGDLSGLYFDEFAKVKDSSLASKDDGERRRLEEWTTRVMKEGGWI